MRLSAVQQSGAVGVATTGRVLDGLCLDSSYLDFLAWQPILQINGTFETNPLILMPADEKELIGVFIGPLGDRGWV